MDIGTMGLEDFLQRQIQCECGRTHFVDIDIIEISAGALKKVPEIIKSRNYARPFIISDLNTFEAAGKRLIGLLEASKIPYVSLVLEQSELIPNEHILGSILMDFDSSCDLIVGVGSGTINDICRFFSHSVQLPYYILATAPSMDGYASDVAPLIKNNLKTTFPGSVPKAIVADLEIIAQAPKEMIAAGFGDILAKYTCLADWKLSALINSEYYCERIVEITRYSLEKTLAVRKGIARGDQSAIGQLMEALILSGIAMSYAGNSRPASGSEHHLSHFWEVRFLLEKRPQVLHGAKVGVATILVAELYRLLRQENHIRSRCVNAIPPILENWKDEMKRVFRGAARDVILLEETAQKNGVAGHKKRVGVIAKNWGEIFKVLDSVPDPEIVAELLAGVAGPTTPAALKINGELVFEALIHAKEIRARYTVLQLLWDLDLLMDYAERLTGNIK